MQSIETYGTFEQAIAKADPEAQELARQARKMIIAVMPEVVEVPWPRLRIASYGVGPKKNTEHFCYISAQKHDINLGFYHGAELPDPEGLLQGTGKRLRHIKIREAGALGRVALQRLLKAATTHRMPQHSAANRVFGS
jgi:hypothetical protein